jgi:hypothetical protein
VELLIEMSFGGNLRVQTEVVEFIHVQDRDNKLVHHLETRIKGALELIVERKEVTEKGYVHISDVHKTAYEDMV